MCLDEPFRLAISARGVGSGAQMAYFQATQQLGKLLRTISCSIVRHDACNLHSERAVVTQGCQRKGDRTVYLLVRQDQAESDSRMVINGHMKRVITGIVGRLAPASYPMSGPHETSQPLGIQMQQFAGRLTFVATFNRDFPLEKYQGE